MVRGDGELGTFDDGVTPRESWSRVATFETERSDGATLIPDGTGVAVIGNDPAQPDRLMLARRDHRGRWRVAPLLHADEYGSWDGIEVLCVEPHRGGRVRMLAMPWQGGECGYAQYLDVTFDLDIRRVRVTRLGEERPDDDLSPDIDGLVEPVRDRAGRWVGLADDPASPARLIRVGVDER